MGRNKIPDELKVIHGTDQPVRMTKAASAPNAVLKLAAPGWMTLPQKRMFRSCAAILANWKLLTEADEGIIAMYVTSLGRWIEAEEHLKSEGAVVWQNTENGPVQKQNLWLGISQAERKAALSYEQQLGFTPISRAKILSLINQKEEVKDEFSDFDS